MVEVGGRPLLRHIMKLLCGSRLRPARVCARLSRSIVIKRYFLDYHALRSDVTISLADGTVEYATREVEDWRVTSGGPRAKLHDRRTGQRVEPSSGTRSCSCAHRRRAVGHRHHRAAALSSSHGRLATRYRRDPALALGELVTDGPAVRSSPEPTAVTRISGGFFVFHRAVLERLSIQPRGACSSASRWSSWRGTGRCGRSARRVLAFRRPDPRSSSCSASCGTAAMLVAHLWMTVAAPARPPAIRGAAVRM